MTLTHPKEPKARDSSFFSERDNGLDACNARSRIFIASGRFLGDLVAEDIQHEFHNMRFPSRSSHPVRCSLSPFAGFDQDHEDTTMRGHPQGPTNLSIRLSGSPSRGRTARVAMLWRLPQISKHPRPRQRVRDRSKFLSRYLRVRHA